MSFLKHTAILLGTIISIWFTASVFTVMVKAEQEKKTQIKLEAKRLRELGCITSPRIGQGNSAPYTYYVWICPGMEKTEILYLGE